MRRTVVSVFVVRTPALAPEPGPQLSVEAAREDDLLEAAEVALRERGLKVRALSFGPTGLVAYAEVAS